MKSHIETLSEISGMKRSHIAAIGEKIKENIAKLKRCPKPHDFSICLDKTTKEPIQNPTPNQRLGCYWQCTKCGGWIDSIGKIHYVEGLQDGLAVSPSQN